MEQQQKGTEQTKQRNLLQVIDTNQRTLDSSYQEFHSLITYKKEGSSLPVYVSDLYLQQRVKRVAEEEKEGLSKSLVNQQEEESLGQPRKHRIRYFQTSERENQIRFARCFKCGRQGHTVKHCQAPVEENKCMFCLGEHPHNNCNTKNCFLCNQTGHFARECKAPRTKCRKCGNKGHSEQECGVIVFLNSSGIRFDRKFREQYGFDDLMRVRCLAQCKYPVGHFNCHQYEDISQKFYSQSSIEKTIVRQNYILSNFNKLRELYFKNQIVRNTGLKQKAQRDGAGVKEGVISSEVQKEEGMEITTTEP